MVLQADDRQFGLVVDEINDTEEIVVKPLGKQLKGLSCFAGATIMGDGQVALILDVLGMAQMASVVTELHEQAVAGSDAAEACRPLCAAKLAAVPQRQGQPAGAAAVGGSPAGGVSAEASSSTPAAMKWCSIGARSCRWCACRACCTKHATGGDPLQVVVFNGNGRSLGLVVDRIEDITDEAIEVRDDERKGFLLGSAVIQQKVTDIVDLQQVVAHAAQLAAIDGAGRRRLSHGASSNSARSIWTACCLESRWRRCRRSSATRP